MGALLVGAFLGVANAAESAKTKFGTTLKGANETPPVSANSTGTATFTVSGTSVNYKITASGLSGNATAAHIHVGSSTASGPVVLPFPAKAINNGPDGSVTISGSFTSADVKPQTNPTINNLDDLLAQMRAGSTYVNIHTAAHAIATGQDWRAIEAGAHAFACREGQYRPLSNWYLEDGLLLGNLELPLAVGTVGGPIKVHSGVQMALKLLRVSSVRPLA